MLTCPTVNQSRLLQWQTASSLRRTTQPDKSNSTERRENTCSTPVSVWDLLPAALSYLVSGSGEDPIPDGLMTLHFPHQFISLTEARQTCSHDHPIINYESSKVWIIKNAALFFLPLDKLSWFCYSRVGIPLLFSFQGRSERMKIMNYESRIHNGRNC